MTRRIAIDRSRVVAYQRCPRSRWLEYHEAGTGLGPTKLSLPLAVGQSVHVGLESLLRGQGEEAAVLAAVSDFERFRAPGLDIGDEGMGDEPSTTDAGDFGDPVVDAELAKRRTEGRNEADARLFVEQVALVEAMVRAYARRRLAPLLEEYEVLEVEREGEWLLADWQTDEWVQASCSKKCGQWSMGYFDRDHHWPRICPGCGAPVLVDDCAVELWFLSRLDALLRHRESNALHLQSFKTTSKWDRRKAKDAGRDLQGLTEGVEVEKRLGEWWREVKDSKIIDERPKALLEYLRALPEPPRILAVRYEYLLKGDRWVDKDLSAQAGFEVRTQRSPLVRAYCQPGMAAGDEQWNVSWDYLKDDGSLSKLYYKSWKARPVYEAMPVKAWIDKLDSSTEAVAEEGRAMGWSSAAQATGYLTQHPLDACFVPPMIVYRNDDDLRDMIEQVERQEADVARAVDAVHASGDEDERRSLLNRHFPQHRHSCSYPSECAFVRICFGGEDIRRDPLGSGLYVAREPNHPREGVFRGSDGGDSGQ